MWVAQAYPLRRPRQWLTSGGLGTMGFGLPTAIGAALANPERTVVCFSGDGSILMNIQEFATLAEAGAERESGADEQRLAGPGAPAAGAVLRRAHFASRFIAQPDFLQIARGFALPSWTWTPPPTRAPRSSRR